MSLIATRRQQHERHHHQMGYPCAVSRLLLLASLLCACGSHAGESSVPHGPPVAIDRLPVGPPLVTPGEHMSYRLSLEGMDLATFDLAIGEPTVMAGRRAVVVQTHAQAAGLVKVVSNINDTFTSWVDVTTGRPVRWATDEYATKSKNKERTDVVLYPREGDTIPIEFHLNDDPPEPEPQKVSLPDVWDYNAYLIALRSWEAPPGSTIEAEVLRSR